MAIRKIVPYLMFNGDGAAAIERYQRALGATVLQVMHYGDAPGTDKSEPKRIIHATLRIGEAELMLSDSPPGQPVPVGANVQVSLDIDAVADLEKKFAALAEGGKVTMAPHDAFWGARFAMCTDAHGISWMFTAELAKKS
jgi:PhnB protein